MPDDRILRTKLAAAEAHPLVVDRDAALDWLDARLEIDGAVVLSALPGSGRLELLARWSTTRTADPTAWLRMGVRDDAARYLRHLIAALRTVDVHLGADLDAAFDGGLETLRDEVLPALIDDCERHRATVNLVIHGIDRVVDPLAIQALRATQRNRPANVRIIWMADDGGAVDFATDDGTRHLHHIDPDLLAFSGPQVRAMYDQVGITITDDAAAEVVRATGGWALAVLHLVDAARTRGSFAAYDPEDRSLVERIEQIVMRRVPTALASVASDLAVIGPATRSELEVVADRPDAAEPLARLQELHLIRRHGDRWSVVVPLRSHLRFRRGQHDFASAVVLRRRMARSLATAGEARGALDMLAAAGDHQARARLLLERHRQWSGTGDRVVVDHADAALQQDPSLIEMHLVLAWYAALNAADIAEASAHIEAVQRIPLTGARASRARNEIEFLEAMVARRAGRLEDGAAHARAGCDVGELVEPESLVEQGDWPYVAVAPGAAPLYLGHSLFHGGEIDEARAELLRASTGRPWSPPALAAIHGVLGVIGWLEDDPSARIHGVIAASHLGPRINASNHLAAAALILTTSGPDAAAMAARYRREVPRIGEPTSDVFGHVVAALTGDADEAGASLVAARRVVDRCAQPGVLSLVVTRASAQLAPSDQAPTVGEALTAGERRVVLAFRGDLTEREIAAELHLSHNTVRTYRRRAYAKLGATSRQDAVAKLAIRDGRSD